MASPNTRRYFGTDGTIGYKTKKPSYEPEPIDSIFPLAFFHGSSINPIVGLGFQKKFDAGKMRKSGNFMEWIAPKAEAGSPLRRTEAECCRSRRPSAATRETSLFKFTEPQP